MTAGRRDRVERLLSPRATFSQKANASAARAPPCSARAARAFARACTPARWASPFLCSLAFLRVSHRPRPAKLREQLFRVAPVVAASFGPLPRSLRVARRVRERLLDGREGLGEAHLVCVHRCHFSCGVCVARRQAMCAATTTLRCHLSLPCGRVWANSPMLLLKLAAIKTLEARRPALSRPN